MTAAGTTNFIWDGQDVLLETDVSNNTQVTYTQTPDIYGNLVSQRRDSTTSFYHHDAGGRQRGELLVAAAEHANDGIAVLDAALGDLSALLPSQVTTIS